MVDAFYLQIAEDIRDKIRSGEYKVGEPIPPSRKLEELYGRSNNAVRAAVNLLKSEGVLERQSTQGVYVRAKPAARQGSDDLTELRATVGRLEADLAYLYDATGVERIDAEDQADRPARRKRA